jgi:hypothetical protein
MPHNNHQPHYHPNNNSNKISSSPRSCSASPRSSSSTAAASAAQRPHILYTLASEVLAVAEQLDYDDARRRWAGWADTVFLQMHMGADVDAWRARVGVARAGASSSSAVHTWRMHLSAGMQVFCSARTQRTLERVFLTVSERSLLFL